MIDISTISKWSPKNKWLEIKTIVDGILGNIQNDGGLNAFETIMNSSNNTSEIIDSSIGIIDIIVEPVKGLEKLVQRVTILKIYK